MLIAAHALVGGAVGQSFANPYLAFGAGFCSHFLADAIPHYDTFDHGKMTFRQIAFIAGEAIFGFLLAWAIIHPVTYPTLPFWSGVAGGLLPDVLDNAPPWQKSFRSSRFGSLFHKFHGRIQWDQPGLVIGISTQFLAIVIAAFLIKRSIGLN